MGCVDTGKKQSRQSSRLIVQKAGELIFKFELHNQRSIHFYLNLSLSLSVVSKRHQKCLRILFILLNKITVAFLEKAKDICATRAIKAEMVTEVGDPKTAICNAVQKLNINLLVLGDRSLGKIKRPKSKLVEEIVNDITKKLKDISPSSYLEGLVGIRPHIERAKQLLCIEKSNFEIVGIWGMGGIGKTTITKQYVVGSSLHEKTKQDWESALHKLNKISNPKIH
ncbi:hypothetical protein LWI29_018276 [Acer saccharum]|uniref:NB-ARC domain-containing protein n=1 Tax=Acer saccharum TaxID=4024 RepID=A0AA39T0G2_ACESA|nr:hypothetical protein LWI29_018276 [Acer saccharum]